MATKTKAVKVNPQEQGGGPGVMKFKVLERIVLLNILPQAGDYTTLGIVRKLQERLSFTEAEHEALKLGAPCETCSSSPAQHKGPLDEDHKYKAVLGRLAWEAAADTGVELKVGPKGREIIADQLKALSEAKKLTLPQYGLYERFCGNGHEPDEDE